MICITFQRVGYHHYPNAPIEVSYLENNHRHLFKFKVCIEVFSDNRELEFHQFLTWVESLFDKTLSLNNKSCEMVADDLSLKIGEKFPARELIIEVWEDGECGSITEYQPRTES